MTNNALLPRTPEDASAQDGRIERISHFEAILKEGERAVSAMERALEDFASAQEKLSQLSEYYGSRVWREDFEASEAGKLPPELPCGVLSEDGIWNLLERNRELIEEGRALLERLAEPAAAETEDESV